jgi:hypothetical protein
MGFFPTLMVDQFGNYLAQKIFEVSTEEELGSIADSFLSELGNISLNVHGTRAVQSLVEILIKGQHF